MKVGDWVFFKTHNWPKDVRYTSTDPATGETKDITGQGLYEGRGKIIGVAGDNYTVREEKSNRLVEVGPNPEDVIRPLGFEYATLTLGNLREFLERHKDAPNDIPVTVALPQGFFCDEDDLPPLEPEHAIYWVAMTTPYILIDTSKTDWVSFLQRTLLHFDGSNDRTRLYNLLKCGLEPNYWNEFVFKAYHHHQQDAVFLAGIPDLKSSLPHA